MTHPAVVVIGAGHAGYTLTESLRSGGFDGRIVLVDEQSRSPYERPPLSKAFLDSRVTADQLNFCEPAVYQDREIELLLGRSVADADFGRHVLTLDDGTRLDYTRLVIATGSKARRAPWAADYVGVHHLTTYTDAEAVRSRLRDARSVLVVGAGFIGLEFASTAAKRGLPVTVVEAGSRILGRTASPELSAYLSNRHRDAGVELRTSVTVVRLLGHSGVVTGAELSDGSVVTADLVLVGIGSVPSIPKFLPDSAIHAGSIDVDHHLHTAIPDVDAIGDVARFPYQDRRVRLESVQNATEQGRVLASNLCGRDTRRYEPTPWFWTEQTGTRVQIAGLVTPDKHFVTVGDKGSGKFTVLAFEGDCLVAGESVGAPADHMAVRTLLAKRVAVTPRDVDDPGTRLRDLARAA